MRETLLYLLQNLLVIDGLILLLWLLERMFCRNAGHLWRKVLWLFICIRMLIPMELHLWDLNENWTGVQFEIQVETSDTSSIVSEVNEADKKDGIQVYEPVRGSDITATDPLHGESYESADEKSELTIRDFLKEYSYLIFAVIWITGFIVTLFYHILQYYFVKEFYFEDAHPCTDRKILTLARSCAKKYHKKRTPLLYEKEQAATPMTFGYFRHKIIFPPRIYDEEEMELILQHEMTHLKFFDAWYKTLVLFICDLYWFNPVFLLMKRMAYRDVEFVCDEYVTKKMSELDKKTYGAVILKTVTEKYPRPVPSVVQLSCSQKELKRRLNNLFEFRKWGHGAFPLLISMVLIAILVMGISFTVKEVPMQLKKASDSVPTDIQISKVTEDESMSGPYYTDDLEALVRQKDIESSYITERFNGWNHYFIDESGTLWGSGSNNLWQLGIAEEQYRNNHELKITTPVKIAENVIHVDMSTNSEFVIYLTDDGNLYGLGANLGGVLRMPVEDGYRLNPWESLALKPQLLMTDVAFASAGRRSISVLTKDGNVWWWGEMCATTGTTGPGYLYSKEPKLMLENARYTVCGHDTAAAIDQDNNLWLWGCNVWGQCGLNGNDYIVKPYLASHDVEMVWIDLLSTRQNVYDKDLWWGMNPYSFTTEENEVYYAYNTFIRKTDGKMYACGIDLGYHVKSVSYYGDIFIDGTDHPENYTRDYSPYFIPISVEEIRTKEPQY